MDLYDPIHKKVIGVTFIVFSFFGLIGIYFFDLFYDFIIEKIKEKPDVEEDVLFILNFVDSFLVTIAIVFYIPRLLLGVALTTGQKWANIPSLVYGALSIINFPVGTALGIYCILVFTAKEKPRENYERRNY